MTRPIGSLDRIRWTTALLASTVLAILAGLGLHELPLPSAPSAAAPAASSAVGSTSPLDPAIANLAAAHPQRSIEAIVQFKPTVSPARTRWDVSRVQGHVFGELHIINALAVRLTAEHARRLAASPDVRAVSLNAVIKAEGGPDRGGHEGRGNRGESGGGTGNGVNGTGLATTYNQTLGAAGLWRDGIDGQGVGVAVIDTGIDGALPDFQGPAGSRVVATAVVNPGARTATDGYGHGTDVAGIIAGNGNNLPPSDPARGDYIGVAPEANLVSIKISDEQGNATVLDVINGLQFAIDHQSDYNIRVINMSLDSVTRQSYATDPLDAAAEAAWNHGIAVVAAAGNRGTTPDAVQYAPANDPYVITVGGADENGTADPSDDFIASWSSQGTTQDGFQKPDVYAPGAHIVSVLAPNSVFSGECLPCQVDGRYIRTSGTSMAAAVVSGLVADVLQAHPRWSPDQVKGALTSSSVASNSLREVDAAKVVGLQIPAPANARLTPNQLIDPTTGGIDYARASWSRASWSIASGSLSADFARASWSCACSAAPSDVSSSGDVDSARASWSRASWSTYVKPGPNG